MNGKTRIKPIDPNPGGDPAVVLLHGLGATAASWSMQMEPLAEAGYRPIAVDLPGFGESPMGKARWSIAGTARTIAEWLKEWGVQRNHIVGLSLGGVVAQQMAHEFPEQVRSITLVSTFSILRSQGASGRAYFIRRAAALAFRGIEHQAWIVAKRVFPQPSQQILREILVRSVLQADRRAYRQALFSLAAFDSRPWLGELSMPALVVMGSEDTTITPDHQEELAGRMQNCRKVMVQEANHAIPVDHPDEFNAILIDFLNSK